MTQVCHFLAQLSAVLYFCISVEDPMVTRPVLKPVLLSPLAFSWRLFSFLELNFSVPFFKKLPMVGIFLTINIDNKL